MGEIKRVTVDGEVINIKKSFDNWRIVYPIRNIDNTINKKHLLVGGSYWNIAKILIIFLIIYFLMWSYKKDMNECTTIANTALADPCKWCQMIQQNREVNNNFIQELNMTINFSSITDDKT